MAHNNHRQLIDKPLGYVFVRTVGQFEMNKTYLFKNDNFYFVLIMKLRKCNLRTMMNLGLLDDQMRRQILGGIKQVITSFISTIAYETNGDLK